MRYAPPFLAREARVRREYAHLYEGWDARAWAPAAQVADGLRGRLPDEQFEFRGGAPRRPGLRARTRRSD
ncbi:MAG: hypothetical protein ACREOC_18675 [Gemmatimonadales bacterium]